MQLDYPMVKGQYLHECEGSSVTMVTRSTQHNLGLRGGSKREDHRMNVGGDQDAHDERSRIEHDDVQYDDYWEEYDEDGDDSEFAPSPSSAHSMLGPSVMSVRAPLNSTRRSSGTMSEDSVGMQGSASEREAPNCTPSGRKRRATRQECFIEKLFKMATNESNKNVFGFSEDGRHLEIRNPAGLSPVLNRYFKHGNTSSFIRQLNNYAFKTMSSVSTGKSIQCFIHPLFHRNARPEDLERITRKTARVMKKCKREIIRELQTEEMANRERLKELERMNARLEQEIRRLQRQNVELTRELHARERRPMSELPPLVGGSFISTSTSANSFQTEAGSQSSTVLNNRTYSSYASCTSSEPSDAGSSEEVSEGSKAPTASNTSSSSPAEFAMLDSGAPLVITARLVPFQAEQMDMVDDDDDYDRQPADFGLHNGDLYDGDERDCVDLSVNARLGGLYDQKGGWFSGNGFYASSLMQDMRASEERNIDDDLSAGLTQSALIDQVYERGKGVDHDDICAWSA